MRDAPRVLLVTGAYHPEISAAGVQCRAVAAALGDRVRFSVLTTAVDRSLPLADSVDGVPVRRVPIDVRRRRSVLAASGRTALLFAAASGGFDIVHLHGVSRKNVPVTLLARLFGKRIVLHLHTAGQDEPANAGRAGALGPWAFRQADRVLAVSPSLVDCALASSVDRSRVRLSPNGVDTNRFTPIARADRDRLRADLGLPVDDQRSLRERRQPQPVGRRQRLVGPERGALGNGVEAFGGLEAACHLVVVAADHRGRVERLHARDGLVGIRTIADEIAQHQRSVIAARLRVAQARLERLQVGVDVG